MKRKRMLVGSCLLTGLLLVGGPVWADQCDDLHEQGKSANQAGKEAIDRQDYEAARSHYDQAAQCYEQIVALGQCQCAQILQDAGIMAQSYRQTITEVESHIAALTRYNDALVRYDQGSDLAKNNDFAAAIGEFEAAAMIWDEMINDFPGDINVENARKNAVTARESADRARGKIGRR